MSEKFSDAFVSFYFSRLERKYQNASDDGQIDLSEEMDLLKEQVKFYKYGLSGKFPKEWKEVYDNYSKAEAMIATQLSGLTLDMVCVLQEHEVFTVEDLAGCSTDDLIGWTEKNQKHVGYLSDFNLSTEQAEAIIMAARKHVGWI